MLRLLANENVSRKLIASLRRRGVDVAHLQDLGARGVSDEELVSTANELERTILTRGSDLATPSLPS